MLFISPFNDFKASLNCFVNSVTNSFFVKFNLFSKNKLLSIFEMFVLDFEYVFALSSA